MFNLPLSGHRGIVFCIDGSPDFLYSLLTNTIDTKNDVQLQNSLICHTIDIVSPNNDITKALMEKLKEIDSYEERIRYAVKLSPVQDKYSDCFVSALAAASYDRLKIVLNFKQSEKLKSPIVLLRPKDTPAFLGCDETYGLDKYTEGPVTVHVLEGNHVSIIENKDCANIINRIVLDKEKVAGKQTQNVVTSMVENQRPVQV